MCVFLCVCVCVCALFMAPKWHSWPLVVRLLAHQDAAHKEESPLLEARREE